MTRRVPASRPTALPSRLLRLTEKEKTQLFTATEADPPSLYGERVLDRAQGPLRHFDPFRSKLAAALIREPRLLPPAVGERWLYLGAAGGTTVSHVADLVGPKGEVFAVEKSARPCIRLLAIAERLPGLYPLIGDARRPEEYLSLVPTVDGLYLDVSQPDQVAIAIANHRLFLRRGGRFLFCVKLASLARSVDPDASLRSVLADLSKEFALEPPIALAPFHRAHVLLAGRALSPDRRRHAPPAPPVRPAGRASVRVLPRLTRAGNRPRARGRAVPQRPPARSR
ncbi:MAG: fibrillarin-like rRNA/tRNA 2'-O-methyltransferase [Thermoplasmata archaeon]|nr:fibrillarin-like rRNA/tRNA 2'-O-methyltransferase [Thermoplasmata archaeon]